MKDLSFLLIFLLTRCTFQCTLDDVAYSLFDLSSDPYEDKDLCANTTYVSNYLESFENLQTYWSNLTIDENLPDSSSAASAWKTCDHVCPWFTDDTPAPTIEQIYFPSNPPNIVYILVDDWGYNDFGLRSTYMNWTTPNLDRLATEGILLDNYYTNEICAPSRASFMTGRYNLRLGVYTNNDELPLTETTLAQELKSAGYRNYIVGKWHLGHSTWNHYPPQRGFDYFYGYSSGSMYYWSKTTNNGYVDLFENNDFVVDEDELDDSYHSALLFQSKAEAIIDDHAMNYKDTPFFLYYALQLIHAPWTAPESYLARCTDDSSSFIPAADEKNTESIKATYDNYCAMDILVDEIIANLTCSLESNGFSNNTILIIAGDNGGEKTIAGNSLPFRGHKGSLSRGGISNNAFIHSPFVPEEYRGTSTSQLVHITDWLPTFMYLATEGAWNGSYSGAAIDGVNVWDLIFSGEEVDRTVIFHSDNKTFAAQMGSIKYLYGTNTGQTDQPLYTYAEDLDPTAASFQCENPSLVDN